MSLFDYPRINFLGTIQLNPGTANNDDYAPNLTLPAAWGPFAGAPLALMESKLVEARTYGMPDADFIAWAQQPQTFDVVGSPGKTQQQIPAEWNYYGDMSSSATAQVVGIETGPGQHWTAGDPKTPITSLIGAAVSFNGGITDVNSQGSPPATQFFIDSFTLQGGGGSPAISGAPSKGACQWLNFYRNVNLTADGGAGGYVYHVLRAGKGTTINVPGMPSGIAGVIIRYYIYNTAVGTVPLPSQNPATAQIVGTIAPLLADEDLFTGPAGRLLVSNTASIPTPPGAVNNSTPANLIQLAPAVLRQQGDLLSADFSGTFPDYFQPNFNPKYDFGGVTLLVTGNGTTLPIAPVPYADTSYGNARGWLFDFDLSANGPAKQALADPAATFSLTHALYGTVLSETGYYVVSNQQGIYAEQNGPGDLFLNQGTTEPATISVYQYGRKLAPADCPPVTVWQYRSIPLEAPGNATVLSANLLPGDPLTVDTSQPGNYLFTFTINNAATPAPAGYPPQSYLNFQNPPWITNAPSISLRILPNNEDFSRYYADPSAKEPVGNDLLTFAVVYAKVLRMYYLLYPAMNAIFPLNDEKSVSAMAAAILDRTNMKYWMTTSYMPRTRDLSQSRKTLLQAWCRKVGKK
jgi:hypothetical protein